MDEKASVDLELLAYLEGYLTAGRKARFSEVLSRRTRFLTVALEDVYQLHNASAVIRSCDVFGIQDAHLIEGRFGQRVDKNIAMGAQQWVDTHRYACSADCIKALRSRGYRIVATTPSTSAVALHEFNLDQPAALFFGTEKEGLTPEVLGMADEAIYIPMAGFTESLNISVAAAIILQELSTRLRQSGLPWQLSGDEILEKRYDWACKTIKSSDEIIARYRGAS
jgi:tRNA (guanosine-2'-O-)-methyltransferase